ncbi:uncharacterized protein BDR25DRAFT_40685 [Lindgomyces ingoldianus]|uniref:Uncharacterized protein n=1 Tax=Lindgomyces ingoldianus TaxID=673940 RepID=A0ACB6QSD0_9PLEO|nr:uncharacterized protein BDR25DRAFT_40685 [Lindgomyces ingoldianus]KAF2469914.1 hypothetical protein BDR25DRAFT_40685 [Lindgomyces ingoldianus]
MLVTMFLQFVVGLSVLGWSLAAPPLTTITPSPPLPSICGVLSYEPACPTGYACQPIARFCTQLEPDELCGTCSPISTTTTATCPSGYTRDYRYGCRPTTTATSSKSTLTCPPGYTADYRGYSYCRATVPATALPETRTTPCAQGMTPDYRGFCRSTTPTPTSTIHTCSPGWTTDYRGLCKPTPTPTDDCVSGSYQDYRGMCRSFTHTFTPSVTPIEKRQVTCSPGWTTNYRGYCFLIPSTSAPPTTPSKQPVTCGPGSTSNYRGVCFPIPSPTATMETQATTEGPSLKCDTRHDPDCPVGMRCVAVEKCPPYSPFCEGVCVGKTGVNPGGPMQTD